MIYTDTSGHIFLKICKFFRENDRLFLISNIKERNKWNF
ncbi:hypothetical protein X874_17210 [Mannheimia varigena USDA-ARS-USMARC-1312]|nr:hypothetical protein X874_17210 [Mannheimia varigena USDA-ARS-USMARC-1312]